MTDKKIADEEIIKRLECMLKMLNNNIVFSLECGGCTFDNGLCSGICSKGLMKVTVDLINRQKSEIERYKRYYYRHEYDKWEKQIKSEAYKEFVERLKEKLDDCHIISDGEYCGFDCGDVHKCIDNLLKEMVGEEECEI